MLFLPLLFLSIFSASVWGGLTYYKTVIKCLNEGEALMTFDGGPNANNTQKLLDTLKKENVTGAFFLTSNSVNEQSGLAMQIMKSGHVIGYRFEREWNLTSMSDEGLYNSIERCLDNLKKKIGERPRYIRLNDEGKPFHNV